MNKLKIISQNKNLRRTFLKYLLPSVTSMWIFSLYTLIDGIFVSRGVTPIALAAVNISMPFISFIFAVSLLLTTGASTVIAIYLGKGNREKANRLFTFTTITIVILALSILAISLLNLEKLIIFLGATKLTMPYVKDYLRIIILFNGFFMISYSMEVMVKIDGFPHFSIIGITLSAIMNIFLDYVFVIKLKWGVSGAAYATGISQASSAIFYLTHFVKKNSKLSFTKFNFNKSILKKILSIGFPDFTTELSIGIVIFLFNQTILKYIGENGVVTYSIINAVNALVINTMIGITQGMQPLSSYNYGKGDKSNVRGLLKMSLKTITIASILAFGIVTIFAQNIVGIYISKNNKELFEYAVKSFRIFSVSFLFVGYNINISGFFASVAKPRKATIISLGRGFIFIIPSLFIMTSLLGPIGIWMSTIASEIISLCVSFIFFKKILKVRLLKIFMGH